MNARYLALICCTVLGGVGACFDPGSPVIDGQTSTGSSSSSDSNPGPGSTSSASDSTSSSSTSGTTEAVDSTGQGSSSSSTTGPETTTTGPAAECGNGRVELDEQCDGTDWDGATCESLGASPGSLNCTSECAFDLSECVPDGMVLVPAGEFEMGSMQGNSQPIRQVEMQAYWIDEFEVTVAAYAQCVIAGECGAPDVGSNCNWMVPGREDHPVNCVTWFEAEDYCAWTDEGTKRLPTEAEWEKAARGTDARNFPWGNAPLPSCTHAIVYESGSQGCGEGATWPVGSRPLGASPYGAQDMAGNVWEWVADWYAPSYDPTKTSDPTGPAMGMSRSMRGGGLDAVSSASVRTTHRIGIGAESPTYGLTGFRCAQTIPDYEP